MNRALHTLIRRPSRVLALAPQSCAARRRSSTASEPSAMDAGRSLRFHHVQFYVDSLQELSKYKEIENELEQFATELASKHRGSSQLAPGDIASARELWETVAHDPARPADYLSSGQDVVQQMLYGVGWRVTAANYSPSSNSVLVTSADPSGVRFVVTASTDVATKAVLPAFDHFDGKKVESFMAVHAMRPGVGVLAFETTLSGGLNAIHAAYAAKHPKLLTQPEGWHVYCNGGFQVLEVYAYYLATGEPDTGTVIRFVERDEALLEPERPFAVLPGLELVPNAPTYPDSESTDARPPAARNAAAYTDHWVSNVHDRESFLRIMEETLGFEPKVDFNAGVVAAGEAMIESTVTGNSPHVQLSDPAQLLTNQQQVYLPTNNALSDAGHVHLFLEQLGQGIQHLASRVPDLVAFIQRANAYRNITGEGLAFLNIPRSYYGRLTVEQLQATPEVAAAGLEAEALMASLVEAGGLVDLAGIVELELPTDPGVLEARLEQVLAPLLPGGAVAGELVAGVAATLRRGRYSNLHGLLRDRLSEEEYVRIVRNQILVDIQAGDVLYQIFTAPVMQAAHTADEAPFLEFIQRVCAPAGEGAAGGAAPGCGGFGIRNFLTLFLSIEVNKAAGELAAAQACADDAGVALAEAKISVFTSQLDQSNPVLTQIADAMAAEGAALRRFNAAPDEGAEAKAAVAELRKWRAVKLSGNDELQRISEQHRQQMEQLGR